MSYTLNKLSVWPSRFRFSAFLLVSGAILSVNRGLAQTPSPMPGGAASGAPSSKPVRFSPVTTPSFVIQTRDTVPLSSSINIHAMAFSSDSRLLAIAASHSTEVTWQNGEPVRPPWNNETVISLWDVVSRKRLRTFTTGGEVFGLTFAANNTRLVSVGGQDEGFGDFLVWKVATSQVTASYHLPREGGSTFYGLSFSPQRQLVAVGGFGCGLLIDAQTAHLRATLPNPQGGITYNIAFSPDNCTLATVEEEKNGARLNVWSLNPRRCLYSRRYSTTADHAMTVRYSPDGKFLFLSSHPKQRLNISTLQVEHLSEGSTAARYIWARPQDSNVGAHLYDQVIPPLASPDKNFLVTLDPELTGNVTVRKLK